MTHRFGPFEYDPDQRLLFRDGERIPLLPKVTDTLHVLLEHRGRVVEKAELMRRVWPDASVEEVGLARNVSLLRKALGEPDTGTFIETVPKRGYRFVGDAPLDPPPVQAPQPSRHRVLAGAVTLAAVALLVYWQFYIPSRLLPGGNRLPSLAVIPFGSQTLHDVLVAELARDPAFQLLSPGTVERYRWFAIPPPVMARLIGVDALLEGSTAGNRVTARLSDSHTGKLIWAESFEIAPDPAAQAAAARAIAAKVVPRMNGTVSEEK